MAPTADRRVPTTSGALSTDRGENRGTSAGRRRRSLVTGFDPSDMRFARHVRSSQNCMGRGGFEPEPDVLAHVRSLCATGRVRIHRDHPLLTVVRRRMGRGGFEPNGDVLVRFAHCARLPGFGIRQTCDSLVTSVPRRIVWVGADSNRVETCSFASLTARASPGSNPSDHSRAAGSSLRSSQGGTRMGRGGFEPRGLRSARPLGSNRPLPTSSLTPLRSVRELSGSERIRTADFLRVKEVS